MKVHGEETIRRPPLTRILNFSVRSALICWAGLSASGCECVAVSQMAKPSHLPRLSDQWLTCRGLAEQVGAALADKSSNPAYWAAATLQIISVGAAGAALLCRPP